ncbi:ornithine--oxo-acid transaminase [Bradyrhizobium sp.]
MLKPNLDVSEMFVERQAQRSTMHSRHLNEQLVRVLKTIGYDVGFQKGQGQYLYDRDGARYLDLLSGFGVFAIGRNHPTLRDALKSVLDSDLPNLVQLDVSTLAGVLAERLLEYVPYLDKVFFANSGAETVEAAIKFARGATGRPGIVYCGHSYHGLTYGALSLTDDSNFRTGFEPLLPGCTAVPFNDLAALEQALSSREIAAFIVEPIQGKGVNMPSDEFLPGAAALCKKYGTIFIADEIQTGIGRTGKLLACDYENVHPDILILGKALSGGVTPVSAVFADDEIMLTIAPGEHGSTYGGNPLAARVAIAALEVVRDEHLSENAFEMGILFRSEMEKIDNPMIRQVRGKGLLNAVVTEPRGGKAAWDICLALKEKGLIAKPTHDHIIRFTPPLVIDRDQMMEAIGIIKDTFAQF